MIEYKKIILKTNDEDDFKIKIFITDYFKNSNTKRKRNFTLKKLFFNIKFY